MKIKCFGIARDIVGDNNIIIDAQITSVLELRQYLDTKYQQLNDLKSYMIAVNQIYALDSDHINNADEIALIPPVSGG